MEQLSRPYRIGLGAIVILALAWILVLKPSEAAEVPAAATPAPATAPGVTGLGAAVDKAEGAAAASAARNAATGGQPADPGSQAALATAALTRKAAAAEKAAVAAAKPPADPSKAILRDVDDGKVAVLLFYSRDSTDDRAVRRALTAADRHGGKVAVRSAPIGRVADYTAITEGVDILQAPTLLVIGRDKLAREIVGYTDTVAIDQLVSDVGGPGFEPRALTRYPDRLSSVCVALKEDLYGGDPQSADRFEIMRDLFTDARRALEEIEPPRRYVAFHRLFIEDVEFALAGATAGLKAELAGNNGLAAYVAATAGWDALTARVATAARKAGLDDSC